MNHPWRRFIATAILWVALTFAPAAVVVGAAWLWHHYHPRHVLQHLPIPGGEIPRTWRADSFLERPTAKPNEIRDRKQPLQQVAHGEWPGWLERNFHKSTRTASDYMKLATVAAHGDSRCSRSRRGSTSTARVTQKS